MGTIVVGMDESVGGRAAVEWAIGYAKDKGAEIVVVDAFAGGLELAALQVNTDKIKSIEAQELRDKVCVSLPSSGVTYRIVSQDGAIATALIDTAKNEGADLIVFGHTVHHGLSEHVLGATIHKLLTHTDRPVVIVPAHS